MKVICEQAGRMGACKQCPHNVPHDDQWPSETGLGKPQTCRAVMACEYDEEVVRCVPVKGDSMKTGSVKDDKPVVEAVPADDAVSDDNEHLSQLGRLEGESDGKKDEPKPRRKRKNSNYILEKKAESATDAWVQVKDNFVSPEAAIVYVEVNKLEGVFRAVRVASEEYEAKLTTPEPVLTVKKLKKA